MKNKPFLAGEPVPFRKAYPDVKSLLFTATERGAVGDREQRDYRYTESNMPAKLGCSNPRCQQGGYELQPMLDALTHDQQPGYEADWLCNGHEGSPQGRRKGQPCMNSLSLKIELTYK